MPSIQNTLEVELVETVDMVARKLGTTRSGGTRESLRAALAGSKEREKERKHREGYLRKPSTREEIQLWEKEPVWADM